VVPLDPPTPKPLTQEAIDEAFRHGNRRANMWFTGIIIALLSLVLLVNRTVNLGEDQATSTEVSFAQNARNSCLSDRRSAQSEAQGELVTHVGRALSALSAELGKPVAGSEDIDYATEIMAIITASEEVEKASAALSPEIINRPTPIGCGPPILDEDDLREYQESQKRAARAGAAVATTKE
jgi:hypothetical protein